MWESNPHDSFESQYFKSVRGPQSLREYEPFGTSWHIGCLMAAGFSANENRPYFREHGMTLKYSSGEEIRLGDRVTYSGTEGTIELVVEGPSGDPEKDWNFENNGAGVMLAEPRVFGRVYLTAPHEREDLVLVARGSAPPTTTPELPR